MKTVILTLSLGLETGEFVARLPYANDQSSPVDILSEIRTNALTGVVITDYPMRITFPMNGVHPKLEPLNAFALKTVAITADIVKGVAECSPEMVRHHNSLIEKYEMLRENPEMLKKIATAIIEAEREEIKEEVGEESVPEGTKVH